MSGIFDDSNRQVIPRWLDYRMSCALGLVVAARPQDSALVAFAPRDSKLTDWRAMPNLPTAVDLVAESFILNNRSSVDANAAARFILDHAHQDSCLVRELAASFLERDAPEPTQNNHVPSGDAGEHLVAVLRRSLRSSPLNPVAWSDLSLCYASEGLHEKARRAMLTALSLGPHNRFVLRNAARCFLHLKDPERAVQLLRCSGMCSSDPWIAAAEISIAEGTDLHSDCLKEAWSFVRDSNNSPFALSEVAASLSTIETKSGSRKKAKRLIHQALEAPSENALAQVEWLATHRHTEAPGEISLQANFEAEARHLHRAKQYARSLEAAEKWVRFQPFSSRPLVFATFLASVCLNDDDRAIRIAEKAARANRLAPLLLNNLAFAHARQGNVTAATEALNQIELSDRPEQEVLIVAATSGIVLFRRGEPDGGRSLYRKAVLGFDRLSESRSAAIASFFWAYEEKRLSSSEAPHRIADAKKRVKRTGVFELEDAVARL